MGGTWAASAFLKGFMGPLEKKIEQQHEEGEAQKSELRKHLMGAYFDAVAAGASQKTIDDLGAQVKATMNKVAQKAFDGPASVAARLTNRIKESQPQPQQSQQQPQPQQSVGQQTLPSPIEQGPREAMMAPASDAIMPKQGAIMPPAPGPVAGPGAATLPSLPPMAPIQTTPPPNNSPLFAAAEAVRSKKRAEAEATAESDAQRKLKYAIETAKAELPIAVARQAALLPGKINEELASGQAKILLESKEFQAKIQRVKDALPGFEFSPQQLEDIALHEVGATAGSSSERVEVKGPDGAIQIAFRDPKSRRVFDASGKTIDMTQGYEVIDKPPVQTTGDVRDMARFYELKQKPSLTPAEKNELQALEYRKNEREATVARAVQRLAITMNNANPVLSTETKEDLVSTAEAINEHRMAPSQVKAIILSSSRSSQQAQTKLDTIWREVRKLNPKFNFEEAEANFSFSKTPGFQNTIRFSDSVAKSIPIVINLANQLGNGKVRIINGLQNMTKDQLNDPKLATFQTAALLVADEVAKILQGGGTGSGTSDAKLKQAEKIIRENSSPQAIAASLGIVQQLIGARRESFTAGTYMEGTAPHAPPTPGSNAVGKPGEKKADPLGILK